MRTLDIVDGLGRIWRNVTVPDGTVAVIANGVRVTIPPADGLVPDRDIAFTPAPLQTWPIVERRHRRVVRDTLTPEEQSARFQAMRDKRKAELEGDPNASRRATERTLVARPADVVLEVKYPDDGVLCEWLREQTRRDA